MAAKKWKGFDGHLPLIYEPGQFNKWKPRMLYERFLHRVDWKILRRDERLTPWNPRIDFLRRPHIDAWSAVDGCGRGSGHLYNCNNGCPQIALPFGCGNKWCLHCEGVQASNRVNRIQDKMNRVLQDSNLKVGRAVFTVHPDHYSTAGSKRGSRRLQSRAFMSICSALGVDKQQIAAFTTYHPTSSKRPWNSHPHVELIWIHADISSEGIRPLETHDSGILTPTQLQFMKAEWREIFPRTTNLQVSYVKELTYGFLRYLVRPMAEDVWHALEAGSLGLDRTLDEFALDSITIPSEAEEGLREPGGVIFWPSYHRVRWFGALANNRFGPLMESLGKPPIVQPEATLRCPCCDEGVLNLERDEDGPVCVSVDSRTSGIDNIMFTLWKSNTQKEDCKDV